MKQDSQDPSLLKTANQKKNQGGVQKNVANIRPATRWFARFLKKSGEICINGFINLAKKLTGFENFYRDFTNKNALNRSVLYQLGLLVLFAVIACVSEASAKAQNHADEIRYTKAIDPIEAGQFVRYTSPYIPQEFYIDPDNVALAQMQKNDSFTLAQQLSLNTGDKIDVPQRQDPTYTMQKGETFTQVAQKFNLHVGTLLDANGFQPTDLKNIKPGTVIIVPSSDTNTSQDWLVAINKADADAKQAAANVAAKAAAQKKATQRAQVATTQTSNLFNFTRSSSNSSQLSISVIGYSNEQCLPWAREQTGIQIHGYAGAVSATESAPQVGGIALDRFYGHASVVVGVGDGYIIVHEANWIPGRITERKVSTSAIRGYVY